MEQAICWISECAAPRLAKGLCNAHYRRWRRSPDGPTQPEPPPPRPSCSVDGCSGRTKARGWCTKHYKRWRDYGDTELPSRQPPATKTCTNCGATLPSSDFPPKRRRCRPCRSADNLSWRQENSERVREARRRWVEANQDYLHNYAIQNAERIAETARLRYAADPARAAARKQSWRAANRERDRENARRWRAEHRHHLAARETQRYWIAKTPADAVHLIEARIAYYGGKCWICRVAEYEHIDHVKPLAKGGPHIPANLRPACAPCNLSKNARWPFTP